MAHWPGGADGWSPLWTSPEGWPALQANRKLKGWMVCFTGPPWLSHPIFAMNCLLELNCFDCAIFAQFCCVQKHRMVAIAQGRCTWWIPPASVMVSTCIEALARFWAGCSSRPQHVKRYFVMYPNQIKQQYGCWQSHLQSYFERFVDRLHGSVLQLAFVNGRPQLPRLKTLLESDTTSATVQIWSLAAMDFSAVFCEDLQWPNDRLEGIECTNEMVTP